MNSSLPRVLLPYQQFLRAEALGGILLIIASIVAMVWANSAWGDGYRALWSTPVGVDAGGYGIEKPLILWINDGLMALFFLLVGLEIKRELLVGELRSVRRALLPTAAAIGGMVGPALIFVALNAGTENARAWGVPMATDIAFAVGVMAILGSRVPIALKVFLTAVAIVDDLGAVAVIALFYTDSIKGIALGIAAALFVILVVVNKLGVRNLAVYGIIGALLWFAVLKSGVHATIAGVLIAATIPIGHRIGKSTFLLTLNDATDRLNAEHHDAESDGHGAEVDESIVQRLEDACEGVQSPLHRLEHGLLPWVAFAIMPIFALANAGVDLRNFVMSDLMNPTALGIALGLFFGNQIGIVGMTWLTIRTGLGSLPAGVSWRQIHGASLLAGIGFTMSLFIAGLAFDTPKSLDVAKLGILLGSIVSGVLGFLVLLLSSSKVESEEDAPIGADADAAMPELS